MEEDSNLPPDSPRDEADQVVPSDIEDLNSVLDEYEFIRTIGQGGMGTVYEAVQKSINRPVAIKILQKVEDDEELHFAERFQREVHVMAQMSHANIITVYSFGQTADGQLFFVMEYVKGNDLNHIIQQGELDIDRIFKWIEQICDALFFAHSMGVVHRDIKPGNIMITEKGDVKIADFGLAKLTGGGITDEHTRLTMTNMAMGTPDYVAPEALEQGASVDHRADIYAVGVMLYEMLTGKVPRGAWKPPSSLVEGLHQGFDEIVVKAMEPDQEYRFENALELSKSVLQIRDQPVGIQAALPKQKTKMVMGSVALRNKEATPAEKSAKSTPQKSPSRRDLAKKKTAVKVNKTGFAAVWVGVLVVTALFLVVVVMRNNRRMATARAATDNTKAVSIETVLAARDKKVVDTSSESKKLVGHTGPINGLVLLPGSPLMAVSMSRRDKTLRWWDVEAGKEKNRVDFVGAMGLEISPDGKFLLVSNWFGAELYESATGKKARRFAFGEEGVRPARFSSDSKQLAIGGPRGRVALYDIDSRDAIWVLEPGYKHYVTDIAFIPRTKRIVVSYAGGEKGDSLPARVFEIGKSDPLFDIEISKGLIPRLVTTADGRYLLAAQVRAPLELFDLETGKKIRRYQGFELNAEGLPHFIISQGFFDRDRYLFAGTSEGQLGIWETASGKLVQRWEREQRVTGNVAVSMQHGVIIYGGGLAVKEGSYDLYVLPLPPDLKVE